MKETIRITLREILATGQPVPRGVLLREAARRSGVPANDRKLRGQVAEELRRMEAKGVLVDGGPEVWLAGPPTWEAEESGEN